MDNKSFAIEAVREKLLGKHLTYKQIYTIMDEISHKRFSDVLTTYFAASGYSEGFNNEELYYLTKAMVATGETLHFDGIVADKHSIGGVPGTRTTLIVVPIIAAAGFCIPKSSSRAITTPDGTADDMEAIARVTFTKEELYHIVKKTNGCIVWGGSFNLAPADDIIINVEKPLMFESFDKILVSIMAKKIAFGSNHVIIDLPFGEYVKLHNRKEANVLKQKFEYLADKFDIKMHVSVHEAKEPAGRGVGPILETRESLRVLEQHPERPIDLEKLALNLAGELLELCLSDCKTKEQEHIKDRFHDGHGWAIEILKSGAALSKMKEIIKEQKGNPHITSTTLTPGKFKHHIIALKSGIVKKINSKQVTLIAKILGAPSQKGSGLYLDKKIDEHVEKGEVLFTLYSENMYNLREAKESIKSFPVVTV